MAVFLFRLLHINLSDGGIYLSCFIIRRSPAEFESVSEDSDIFGKDQSFSNGSPHHSFDGSTEFNISYHKANKIINEDISNGTTHVTQLHAVPGFTVMVNSPLQQTEDQTTFLKLTDDSNLDMDFNVDELKAKHLKKTMSHPPNGSAREHVFENDLRPQKGLDNNGFFNRDMFVGISEISLRTQPSELPPPCRPPPAVEGKKGDSSKPVNRNCLAFEGISGDNSPPFFDVEVDASSSAAASAAAIKEAMERAQAKIKSAKELMEKKKEGLQTSYKKDMKEKEGKSGKSFDGSNRKKDETVKGTCEKEDSRTYLFVREEKQKVAMTAPEVAEFVEGEKNPAFAEKYVKGMSEKESWSSTGPHNIDEASEWKEATEFFELVTTDESKIAFEKVNSKKTFVQNIKIQEHEQIDKATTVSFEKHSENGGKVKAAREDQDLEKFEKKQKGAKEPHGHEENNVQSKATKEASEQNDSEKIKVTHEVGEWGENNKSFTMAKPLVGTKKRTGADKSIKEKKTGAAKSKVEQAIKQVEIDHKLMEANKMFEIENKSKLRGESVDNNERRKEAFEQDRNVQSFVEAFEQAENEKTMQKGLEQEENEKRLEETFQRVERERRPRDAVRQEEIEKGQQLLEQKINKKKQKEALKLEDEKKREETLKRELNKKRLKSVYEEKETGNGEEREGWGNEEGEAKLLEEFEQLDIQNMPKEVLEQEAKQLPKDSVDWDDNKGLDKAHEGMEKGENMKEVKLAEGTQVHMEEEDLLQSNELDCGENTQSSQFTCDHDENSGKVKTTQESLAHEENSDMRTEPQDNVVQPRAFGRKNESVDKNIKAPSTTEKYHFRMEGAGNDFPSDGTVKKTSGEIKIKPKVSEKESKAFGRENVKAFGKSQGNLEHAKNLCRVEDAFELPYLDNPVRTPGESASGIGQPYAEKIKSSSQMGSVSENQEREFARQLKEREDRTQAQANLNGKEKEKTMPTQLVKENAEDKRKIETARPARVEEKQKIQKSVQQSNASLAAERKEKISGEVETERMKRERELENERMKRERELENERLRRLEEEREREREREKDRMAVDLATLEARERAFSESRERAERAALERATAEARQRAMAEARERLEKACAEAREKSLAGKAAMEARIRAERSAVERATAEARERAAEKAMAERATFEARERVQRSVSDKFSASSRNNGMRQSSSSSVSNLFSSAFFFLQLTSYFPKQSKMNGIL